MFSKFRRCCTSVVSILNRKDKDKDKKEAEKPDDGSHQGVAVLGIALVAMGEEVGSQMALRTMNHLVC